MRIYRGKFGPANATTLCLDQNYLSGIAKRKPAFTELEPVLRLRDIIDAIRTRSGAAT